MDAPLAAVSARVRYLMIKAGTPVGPAELTRWKSVSRVRGAGYAQHVTERVDRLMELQFQVLRGEEGWDRLEQEVRAVEQEPWFLLVAVMRYSNWRSSWMEYGQDIDFDPLPVLSRFDGPMLWLLGAADPETPLEATVARLDHLERRGKGFRCTCPARGSSDRASAPSADTAELRAWIPSIDGRMGREPMWGAAVGRGGRRARHATSSSRGAQ